MEGHLFRKFFGRQKKDEHKNEVSLFIIAMCLCSLAYSGNTWLEKSGPGLKETQNKPFVWSFDEGFTSIIGVFHEQGFIIEKSAINGMIIVSCIMNDMKHVSNIWARN